MFKLFTKSFRPLSRPILFFFSDKRQHLITLQQELLNKHQTLKGWKTVQLLHSITMARHDPELAEVVTGTGWREQKAQLEDIIGSLSGELHLLPHREVNMLMEVLKERGFTFNREMPIFQALNKLNKFLFGRNFRAIQLNKSLLLVKQLKFPKQTWVKMVSSFLEISPQRAKKEEELKMGVSQFLKLAILVLQEPYVQLSLVKKLVERLVKENSSNLQTLCMLYHITQIISPCLKAKIEYQLARSSVRDVLFNPYSNLQQEKETPKEVSEEQLTSQKQAMMAELSNFSSEIIKLFFSSVDIAKLEESIVKSIESDAEPLTKQSLLFAADIVQLKPTILTYLQKYTHELTPVEFMHLLRKVSPDEALPLLKSYEQKLGEYMSVEEKVFFHLQSHRFFHIPIKVETIFAIVDSIDSITYSEFRGIAKLCEQLQENGQAKIPQILGRIKAKIKE